MKHVRLNARDLLVAGAILALAGCSSSGGVGPGAVAGLTPDGTIEMRQVQVAYIGSGSTGSG